MSDNVFWWLFVAVIYIAGFVSGMLFVYMKESHASK